MELTRLTLVMSKNNLIKKKKQEKILQLIIKHKIKECSTIIMKTNKLRMDRFTIIKEKLDKENNLCQL